METISQFFLYLIRWQFSSPILAVVMAWTVSYMEKKPIKLPTKAEWIGAVIANLIGGCIFFFVDRLIFGQ